MAPRLTVVLVSLLLATPAVIFWLWLVILPPRMELICPVDCVCYTGGLKVVCINNITNDAPYIYPNNVRFLELYEYNISSLEKDFFLTRGLSDLKTITLWRCRIVTIEFGAFNGLTELTSLELSHIEISEILPRTFEKLSSLESLDLSKIRIQYLDFDVFCGLINLKSVYVSYNNITYVHPDVFVGLHGLKEVNLEGNPDLQIPTDSHFINSHSLSHLDISYCNVMSVSFKTFANVTALEWLDLSYNNLISVDINILKELPNLSTLHLYDNPLHCDCQLREVQRLCQDYNIQTAYEETAPVCDTPSEVQGIWWGMLEKGQCLQDNITYSGDYENTTYNYTPTEYSLGGENIQHFFKKYQMPIYASLCIFGTAGNVILLIIIIFNKDMRTVPNLYILNLAISDIIYLIVHFLEAYVNLEWDLVDIRLIYVAFFRRLSVGLSAYWVAVLSIQRYRVTANPLHVRASSHRARRGIIGTVCGVWIVAALFAIPSAIAEELDFEYKFSTQYYKQVVVFELLVSSVVPLCVIAFCYTMTARHVLKSADPISQHSQIPHLNTRKRSANTVLGLTFVFLISNVPYHVFWACHTHNAPWFPIKYDLLLLSPDEFKHLYMVSTCLLLINSCFNPFALFCTSRAFKGHLKRYLTCSC